MTALLSRIGWHSLVARFHPATRTLASGIAAGLAGRAITLLTPLVAIPAFYRYFEASEFGIWLTAVSITSMAVVLDLGIGSALLTRLSQSFSAGRVEESRRQLTSALTVLGSISVGLIVAATGVLVAVWHRLDGAREAELMLSYTVAVVFFLGLPATISQQTLYALQRVGISSAVAVVGSVSGLAASLAAIALQSPVWIVAAAYALPPIIAAYAVMIICFARWTHLRPRLEFDPRTIKDLLSLGGRFLALAVVMAVSLNSDNLIIATKLGSNFVADFAIPARLGSIFNILIFNLFLPMWAANGAALARRDHAWLARTAIRMSGLGLITIMVAGLLVVCFADSIMQLWIGESFPDQRLTLALVVFGAAAVAMTSPYNMLLNALGRPGAQLIPWLGYMVVSLSLKLLLLADDRLWIVAAVSSSVYALLIAPAMIWQANKALAAMRTPLASSGVAP